MALEIGLSYTSKLKVQEQHLAINVGSGDLRVLATPMMMALMENAAMMAVAAELEEGQSTVGGQISSSHIKPTGLGHEITATAELVKVEGRKLWFHISASDDEGIIGEGEHFITICGDMRRAFEGESRNYWIEDTSAATENLLIAAHGMGLGAVWCGVYPQSEKVRYMRELLQLPEYIVPMGIVAIGHPAESPEPKDKWDPERVHVNVW